MIASKPPEDDPVIAAALEYEIATQTTCADGWRSSSPRRNTHRYAGHGGGLGAVGFSPFAETKERRLKPSPVVMIGRASFEVVLLQSKRDPESIRIHRNHQEEGRMGK